MGRPKKNIEIDDFSDRLDWIAQNLDTDPELLRYCNEASDVIKGLTHSVKNGSFDGPGKYTFGGKEGPSPKVLRLGKSGESIPPILIEWVLRLYPDMNREWLCLNTMEKFLERGLLIQTARERWRSAIQLYSKERLRLEEIARHFYRTLDHSRTSECPLQGLRLLTRPGWVRSIPLELSKDTEAPFLASPEQGRTFQHRKLQGLTGDYVSYKGSLTYKNRRKAQPEPQHNGEIFCAKDVLLDHGEFVGFKYDLAHYFDYVNSCEILGAELADWILSEESQAPELISLQFRGSPESAFSLQSRASYPGLNCLTVFLNYKEHGLKGNYFLLHKRDETQLQAQNTVHVIPAGGHQGFSKGAQKKDTALWRTIVREFLEELFNIEALYQQPESWEDFLLYPEVEKLMNAFFIGESAAARIYLHGFGLDPITLKPEVIVTIVVDWEIALNKLKNAKLNFNWEIGSKNLTRRQWAELSVGELRRQAAGKCQSIGDRPDFLDTLPAGAACMLATAKHYDKLGLPL